MVAVGARVIRNLLVITTMLGTGKEPGGGEHEIVDLCSTHCGSLCFETVFDCAQELILQK